MEKKSLQTPNEDADLTPIFDAIINDIPAPRRDSRRWRVSIACYQPCNTEHNPKGKIRHWANRSRIGQARSAKVSLMKNGEVAGSARIEKVFGYRGLNREELDEAFAGDIVALVGVTEAHIGDTIADKEQPEALPTIDIEAPTLSMYLGPNTSPMKGREGEFTTSRQIGDRLKRELETNVALRVEENGIGFTISGRGELHLSVLIETMRREGFEFEVGRPQVVTITEDGVEKEPIEELQIEISSEFIGAISQELGARHAEMKSQETTTSWRYPHHLHAANESADRPAQHTIDRHQRHGDHEFPAARISTAGRKTAKNPQRSTHRI
ncbi:hypothetical protein [Candidatus Minimicrobia naudis]